MDAHVEANVQSTAQRINAWMDWCVTNSDALTLFVASLSGKTKSAIIRELSGGNGIEQLVEAASPTPAINVPIEQGYISEPYLEYEGPNRITGADGKHHLIFTESGGAFPRFVLESGRGPSYNQWVPISSDRLHGLKCGSLMMSEKGYIIPNPEWRNQLAEAAQAKGVDDDDEDDDAEDERSIEDILASWG